jgi:hypothetical protein
MGGRNEAVRREVIRPGYCFGAALERVWHICTTDWRRMVLYHSGLALNGQCGLRILMLFPRCPVSLHS